MNRPVRSMHQVSAAAHSRRCEPLSWPDMAALMPHHRTAVFESGYCRSVCMLETVERSEEHTSELQSLMRISYAAFCLKQHNESIHIQTFHTSDYSTVTTKHRYNTILNYFSSH